jgi:hypothetical protein
MKPNPKPDKYVGVIGKEITPATRAALISFDGSHVAAAKHCGTSISTASRIRRSAGIAGKSRTIYSDADIKILLDMHNAGRPAKKIAELLRYPEASVKAKIQELHAHKKTVPVVAPWVAAAQAQFRKQGFVCQ